MIKKFKLFRRIMATGIAVLTVIQTPSVHASGTAAPSACRMSAPELQLAALLTGDAQRRTRLKCDPELHAFARQRATDMAERGYLSHISPERKGPNQLLLDRGYPLPPSYRGGLSNNIESIAGGIRSSREVWRALTRSSSHRNHILGEDPEFLEQDLFGLAYHQDIHAPHVDYWVIVIARRARPGEPRLLCTPEPSECFRTGDLTPGTSPSEGR
jgi:hypothetical protein